MKRFLISTLAFMVIFSSCGNDKKIKSVTQNEDGTTTTTTTTVDPVKMQDASTDMEKKMEELKKLTPMTVEQLKATLPEEVEGLKRSNFTANSAMGFAYAEGEYKKDDTTNIKIEIYDCAGESGSAMYGLNYWTKMSVQQESSNGYTKTIDFKGGKAVETWENNMNQSTLTYVANDRLLVTLTGHNVKADELKQAADKLNLKVS
ncbi:MAG: hypothetical protein M3Y85_01660 [Bacteroidota bacterium]|nr:hypothetical protein [Bacteroidota bacterium]